MPRQNKSIHSAKKCLATNNEIWIVELCYLLAHSRDEYSVLKAGEYPRVTIMLQLGHINTSVIFASKSVLKPDVK